MPPRRARRSRGPVSPFRGSRSGPRSGAVAAVTYRSAWLRAREAFLALDKPVRRRIGEAIDALAADPRPAAAKMITGAHGVLRIRVGDYRVLCVRRL